MSVPIQIVVVLLSSMIALQVWILLAIVALKLGEAKIEQKLLVIETRIGSQIECLEHNIHALDTKLAEDNMMRRTKNERTTQMKE